jgi:signal transduction histidine kinase
MVEEFMAIGKPIRIRKTHFSLAELLAQVELLVKQQLVSKQLMFRCTVPQGLLLYGDQEQLRLVFLNLLLNAMDVSPAGGMVTVSAERESSEVTVAMQDEGPGIDPSHLDRIFEPYFSKRPDGVGLGLAMAKRIVEAHGGSIIAKNLEGRGACFVIRLPMNEA